MSVGPEKIRMGLSAGCQCQAPLVLYWPASVGKSLITLTIVCLGERSPYINECLLFFYTDYEERDSPPELHRMAPFSMAPLAAEIRM